MDLSRAFSFVFDDEEWVKKILIGGLISFIPLVGGLVVYGYMLEVARRAYLAPDTSELPEWDDFGGYLSQGFFFWLGLVVWALPVILLFICGVLFVIFAGLASGEDAVVGLSIAFMYLVLVPLVLVVSVIAALVIPFLLGRYAIRGRFGAMFEFSEIGAELRRVGVVPLLLVVVTYLVAGSIAQLGVALCLIGVIFTGFYGNLAVGHAAGQVYRLAGAEKPPSHQEQNVPGYQE